MNQQQRQEPVMPHAIVIREGVQPCCPKCHGSAFVTGFFTKQYHCLSPGCENHRGRSAQQLPEKGES